MLYLLKNLQFSMNTVGPYGPPRGERVRQKIDICVGLNPIEPGGRQKMPPTQTFDYKVKGKKDRELKHPCLFLIFDCQQNFRSFIVIISVT